MRVNQQEPQQVLNKTYGKVKPEAERMEGFKAALTRLLAQCDSNKAEEFNKNLLIDFLKQAFYGDRYFINTKDKSDLVIHNDQGVESSAGVIFETKKPTKTYNSEMPRVDNLNTKAFQQLVLYFLRERVALKNVEIKHLIVTNIQEWFIFDAQIFETLFAQDKGLVQQFKDFEEGRLSGKKTVFFYQEIAETAIAEVMEKIKFVYFDLRDLDNLDWVALYKILSPEHLLKLPFVNDSNRLNKPFYNELLYIIGLTEVKDKGKKLIGRVKEGDRREGSLIENAMSRLDSLDKISQLDHPEGFGETEEERLFNVALRLAINWINRVLFLKLLEAQLIKYHQGDRNFAFLNLAKVPSYDDLDSLFFDVLAREPDKREARVSQIFANVPYLNSSLFEPTETEQKTIVIGNLRERTLPIFGATVLKDSQGNRRSGELNALAYLFEFLDAYQFDRDELDNPQEDSEKLINASVLGLIFEKINGYKDGSFYTPSFITMYMCRETIRRAVVQKFNEVKGWSCQNIQDLKEDLGVYIKGSTNRLAGRNEANEIFNSLKICDPAVGSGHFLVSALNEMIVIKQYLGILQDSQGEVLSQYEIEVVNDKLKVTRDNKLFVYNPNNQESQRVQETLFHEKQTIIEGCLFGVDINPNSVTICRLRLWIELLKNAYYRVDSPQLSLVDPPRLPLKRGESWSNFTLGREEMRSLETLPNIDINIKVGNSLISRFALDADVKQVLQKQKFTIEQYRNAVQVYRNAETKAQKREMETLIAKIKEGFRSTLMASDPKKVKLRQLQAELYNLENQTVLFEESKAEQKAREKKVTKLNNEIDKLTAEIEDIESGRLYENALEWRFEFPEVLNDDGDFVGFDVVIGNPPYGIDFSIQEKDFLKKYYAQIHVRTPESFNYFSYRSQELAGKKSLCSLIIPSSFLNQIEFQKSRELILNNHSLTLDINLGDGVFEDVTTPTCIVSFSTKILNNLILYADLSRVARGNLPIELNEVNSFIQQSDLISNQSYSFIFKNYQKLMEKCYTGNLTLKDIAEEVATGISSGLDKAYIFTFNIIVEKELEQTLLKKLVTGGEINNFYLNPKSGKYIIYITDDNDIKDFPNIKKELLFYRNQLSKRREAANGKIKWYSLNWPRRKKLFVNPKILVRQTANRIIAAYDNEQWYCLKSGIIIQLPSTSKIEYLCLLSLLNSKLMNFLYSDLVNEDVRIFPEVKPIQLSKLPIVIPKKQMQVVLEEIVNKIISAKKSDPQANTSELEKQIDHLVYKLYQLTYDEVKIIDPEIALTEQEYTAITIE